MKLATLAVVLAGTAVALPVADVSHQASGVASTSGALSDTYTARSYQLSATNATNGTSSLDGGKPIIRAPRVIPSAWKQVGKAHKKAAVNFTLPLKGANMDQLEAKMFNISASQGEWLTREELSYYTAPAAEDVANVKLFLSKAGIPDRAVTFAANNESVSVQTDVKTAEALFGHTKLYEFHYQNKAYTRAKTLHIPENIAHVVLDVQPLTAFPDVRVGPVKKQPIDKVPQKSNSTATNFTSADSRRRNVARSSSEPASFKAEPFTYPECLLDLIGSASYTPEPLNGELDVTIMGYIGQFVSQADLTRFLQYFRPDAAAAGYEIPIVNAAGQPNNGSDPGTEAMLDVEYVVSQNYPLNNQFLNWNDDDGDIFEAGLNYIYSTYAALPGVITTSYGAAEAEITPNMAAAFCATAQKLTALGTTVVYASGDNGVDAVQAIDSASCASGFNPTYPSGCPYVLSVGGSQGFTPEVAVDPSNPGGFYSGGGFSTLFDRPSYQNSAVESYLMALGSNSSGLYNPYGRGFPDVATQAALYAIEQDGQLFGVSGTSCAAPTWSALLSLINNRRRRAGKGRIGWINPTLYGNSSSLTAIDIGYNAGCPAPLSNAGFGETGGWSPVTGLGTPSHQFAALSSLFNV